MNENRCRRPRVSRWAMIFCCNDGGNGMPTGYVEAVRFGIGRGDFNYGTDWVDDHELTVVASDEGMPFEWGPDHVSFGIGSSVHSCLGYKYGLGNWCWDACLVPTHTVREVGTFLRMHGWAAEYGSEILWRWWNKLAT